MDIESVKAFCLSLPGAGARESGAPANVLVYSVADKNFAYFKTSEPERWRFSFRTTPERFIELTDQPGIKPARYMHRFHWVTVVDVTSVNTAHIKTLVQWSYQKALSGLPKRTQRQIAGIARGEPAGK